MCKILTLIKSEEDLTKKILLKAQDFQKKEKEAIQSLKDKVNKDIKEIEKIRGNIIDNIKSKYQGL